MSELLSAIEELGLAQTFFMRLLIDLVAMAILLFALFYPRYRDKELATTAGMFNIFVFCVLVVFSSIHFSMTAGFGLFAILALFTLRSEPLTKSELSYFFGSVVIAVICSVQGTSLLLVVLAIAALLLGAFIVDHGWLLPSVSGTKISLDRIEASLLASPADMKQKLAERLGVDVLSYQVTQIDYITEKANLNVFYRKRH